MLCREGGFVWFEIWRRSPSTVVVTRGSLFGLSFDLGLQWLCSGVILFGWIGMVYVWWSSIVHVIDDV